MNPDVLFLIYFLSSKFYMVFSSCLPLYFRCAWRDGFPERIASSSMTSVWTTKHVPCCPQFCSRFGSRTFTQHKQYKHIFRPRWFCLLLCLWPNQSSNLTWLHLMMGCISVSEHPLTHHLLADSCYCDKESVASKAPWLFSVDVFLKQTAHSRDQLSSKPPSTPFTTLHPVNCWQFRFFFAALASLGERKVERNSWEYFWYNCNAKPA